ncbi:MAG TPA: aminoacyl-tRNA hydrolase [Myxococcota bacterium]|nr:aminoacyl-tRNA hydrolase [Myxococcota bacterium]
MWLIVGLGNPGTKYELTRHNFGFLAIDALLSNHGVTSTKAAFNGQVARCDINGEPCVLLKPETFVNRSGSSVQAAMSFHKLALENVMVIHDEMDLSLGEIRIKRGGGNGGHNGLKDITRLLGADFVRVRLGIGRPNFKGSEADYVLTAFSDQELLVVEDVLKKTIIAVASIVKEGLEQAQQRCQVRVQKPA